MAGIRGKLKNSAGYGVVQAFQKLRLVLELLVFDVQSRLQADKFLPAGLDREQFVLLNGLVGHGIVDMYGLKPLVCLTEHKGHPLLHVDVEFRSRLAAQPAHPLAKVSAASKVHAMVGFLAHVAGDHTVLSAPEAGGHRLFSLRLLFLASAQPDNVICKCRNQKLQVGVAEIGRQYLPCQALNLRQRHIAQIFLPPFIEHQSRLVSIPSKFTVSRAQVPQ